MNHRILIPLALAATFIAFYSAESTPQTPQEEKPMTAFSGEHSAVNTAQSTISFIGGSSIVDHPGVFTEFDVNLMLDGAEPANLENASLQAAIDIASVKTDSEKLDSHLMKAEFFDAENYPEAAFTSTAINALGGHKYSITGNLTIKNITKEIVFDAVTITDTGLIFAFDVPRKEFNIGKDSYGNKLLDDVIPVEVHIVFE